MPTTPKGFRYPAGTDLISQGDDAIHNLASDVDGFAGWVPAGGASGALLAKSGAGDYAIAWVPPGGGWVPAGGAAGAVLYKTGAGDYATGWQTPHYVPAGGTAAQVLAKGSATDYDVGWVTPAGGGGGVVAVQRCHLRKSTTWSIATSGVSVCPFDVEDSDTDAMHDNVTNNSRITVKTAGWYVIYSQGVWTTGGPGSQSGVLIRQNGSTYKGSELIAPSINGVGSGGWAIAVVVSCVVNDYFELCGGANTGAPATTPEFGAYRLA